MERKVESCKLDLIQYYVDTSKDLLEYFISKELTSNAPIDFEKTELEQKIEMSRKYRATQNFTDIIFDYLGLIQKEVEELINNSEEA